MMQFFFHENISLLLGLFKGQDSILPFKYILGKMITP